MPKKLGANGLQAPALAKEQGQVCTGLQAPALAKEQGQVCAHSKRPVL